MLEGYFIKKVGNNKGAPRIWLEGSQLAKAGIQAGQRYDVEVRGQTIVLQANPDGSRVVSSKKAGEKQNPVIDLNSKELLGVFDGMAAVRVAVKDGEVYILPLASELKKRERLGRLKEKLERGEPLAVGSLSHGGGILSHAIHSGLARAGIPSHLAFANEIRGELIDHAMQVNDVWDANTKPFVAPMQELAFDDKALNHVPKTEILEMGLPCSGASRAGRSKRQLKAHPEEHPEVGHLVVSALVILNKAAPIIVVLENVVEYSTSASASILRNQLRDMGYVTHERVFNGNEWGALENRNRWCMVAVTEGLNFDFNQLIPPARTPQTLRDILDPIPDDHPSWSRMEGLKAKEIRDKAEGKNYSMQVFAADSEKINTITKGYAKVRSTDPKLAHPTDPDLLRQLTVAEHARAKNVPTHLVAGDLSNTEKHEVLGQGIVYSPFLDVGHHVGNTVNEFAGRNAVPLPNRAADQQDQNPVNDIACEGWPDGIHDMGRQILLTLVRADEVKGLYAGSVLGIEAGHVIQDAGRGQGVVHRIDALSEPPRIGEMVKVLYRDGLGQVTQKRAAPQMTLEM
ncbi:DNA cytosine methyltransferase [Chromobacterium vaccinii]|uniref:DNA cytosine methyltransferase n=1 Tax=Chromobacterium vaccinii TaxID=1108595 RepID=UPI003C75EA97